MWMSRCFAEPANASGRRCRPCNMSCQLLECDNCMQVGPVYIIVSAAALIFLNLGRRKAGEASAYSIFNAGFRELPGQLNAAAMDGQLRRGQL